MSKVSYIFSSIFFVFTFLCGCDSWDFEEIAFIRVSTLEVAFTSANSFELKGQLLDNDNESGGSLDSYGFCWSVEDPNPVLGNPQVDSIRLSNIVGGNTFETNIRDLTFDTIYHFRAFAKISDRTFYGNVISRQTNRIQLTTDDISVVNDRELNVLGTILGLGEMGRGVSDYGHCISASGDLPTLDQNDGFSSFGIRTDDGVFSSELKDLQPGVKYMIRSYAKYEPLNRVYYSDTVGITISEIWGVREDVRNPIVSGTRFGGIGFSLNNKGYIGTGHVLFINRDNLEASRPRPDFWEYDPMSGIWNLLGNYEWSNRLNAVSFTIGNHAYVGTGYDSLSNTYLRDFWAFDGAIWIPLEYDFPGVARRGAIAFSLNGKGYVGFGEDQLGNKLDDLWEFDPMNIPAWQQISGISSDMARSSATCFVVNDRQVFIGLGEGKDRQLRNDFYEFNPESGTPFTSIAPFIGEARKEAVALSIRGKGYLGTGINKERITLVDFYEFDPMNIGAPWKKLEDLPGQIRTGAIGLEVNGRGFVGTGLANYGTIGYTASLQDWFEYIP